jgi:peptidoglycan hydrolase-like protein with peptidoglycan-binding domain
VCVLATMLGDVATFSPLKPPSEPRRSQAPLSGATINREGVKRRRRWMLPAGVFLVLVAVLGVLALVFVSAKASLEADASGIAKVGMPLGGGKIVSVSVIGGREQKLVPVNVVGSEIVAKQPVPANETVKVRVVIKRPGWIAWLAGKTQTLTLTYTTPTASTKTHYLTLHKGSPLTLSFKQPVAAYEYGTSPNKLTRKVLRSPSASVTLPHTGVAGTLFVAAQIHPWESSSTAQISYFPGGGTATAVASPKPGATINPTTPITINFSKPVSKVLGSHTPTLTPATTGSWKRTSSHSLQFTPSGYGYGLDAHVQIAMPNGVRLLGGTSGTATSGSWTVPSGSVLRAQQILAGLGYLPVTFKYSGKGVGDTASDQENAAVNPPKGSFSWRYPNTPSQLTEQWKPGASGVVTQGAIMMFQSDHGMTADGVLGPAVWKALINANVHGQKSSFGYSFAMVHEADSGEYTTLWHSGKTIITTPANTGTAAAGGTALGTYPVFEHAPSVTMSGTNPDGSTYVDPGVLWVSYFNGGDALHYYSRGSYGSPQSDGCVEMPEPAAAAIYPYTPIGALVDVST